MIKQSFTLRVLVVSFLVLALPLLIDSFIFFQNSYDDSINDAKTDLRQAANFRTFTLSEIQPVKQVLLRELHYFLDLDKKLATEDHTKLSLELAKVAHVGGSFEIFVLDLGHNDVFKIIAGSRPSYIGTMITSYIKLPEVLAQGKGSFVRYLFSEEEQKYVPFVFVARSIISHETGKPIGILLVAANIENQLASVLSERGQSNQIKYAVLNSDGIVFAATESKLVGKFFDPISAERKKEVLELLQMEKEKMSLEKIPIVRGNDLPFFEFIFDDQVQIGYRANIQDIGISVVSYSSKEQLFGKAVRHFLFIYCIYGLILVLGGGVAYWLSLLISRPLRKLSSLMGEVKQGNLDVRFEKEPLGFEINILGEIFNNTLTTLLDNIQKAEDERVKKETYQREVAIGQQVQRSLLPSMVPAIKGAEIAGNYLPAIEAGGDFYSYTPRITTNGEEVLFITVADAAGKGISTCLYSLSARSLLRSYATMRDDPGEVLKLTNNAFLVDAGETGMFMTMFNGVYHSESKLLSYYSCGHPPPIVRRANGTLVELEHSGIALGLKKSEGYPSSSIQLEKDDVVVFFTDGLTDSVNEKNEPFSVSRLKGSLVKREWMTAQDVVDELSAEVQAFIGNVPQEEEVIIVALKVDA